jgi:hypothetical protein
MHTAAAATAWFALRFWRWLVLYKLPNFAAAKRKQQELAEKAKGFAAAKNAVA